MYLSARKSIRPTAQFDSIKPSKSFQKRCKSERAKSCFSKKQISASAQQFRNILNSILSLTNLRALQKFCQNYFSFKIGQIQQRFSTKKEYRGSARKTNQFKNYKIGQLLLSNGLFVKHLAKVSERPSSICHQYADKVKTYKDVFKDYYQQISQNGDLYQKYVQKQKQQTKKQLKRKDIMKENDNKQIQSVLYSEFIKEYPKKLADLHAQFQRSQKKRQLTPSTNKLKRQSIFQFQIDDFQQTIEKLDQTNLGKLSLIEQEVIRKYFSKNMKEKIIYDQETMEVTEQGVIGYHHCFQIVRGVLEHEDLIMFPEQKKIRHIYICIWLRNRKTMDSEDRCDQLGEGQVHYLANYKI